MYYYSISRFFFPQLIIYIPIVIEPKKEGENKNNKPQTFLAQ